MVIPLPPPPPVIFVHTTNFSSIEKNVIFVVKALVRSDYRGEDGRKRRPQTSREREREMRLANVRNPFHTREILCIEAACFLRFSYSTIEFHPRR